MRVSVGEKLSGIEEIVEELKACSRNVGAVLIFIGVVREESHRRHVKSLTYEAHRELAEKKIMDIAKEVKDKYGLLDLIVEHRVGNLSVGEKTMIVGIASKHRGEAIRALEELIDDIKHGVPIWKKEIATEGEFWIRDETSESFQIWINGKPIVPKKESRIYKDILGIIEENLGISLKNAQIKIVVTKTPKNRPRNSQ